MKPSFLFAALLLGLAAMLPAQASHQSHDIKPAAATEAPAERWATDAALREGMGRIRDSVASLQHYEHGHASPEQAVALATSIEQDIRFLIANCKLEPAADAALHAIIARLAQAAQAFKADPRDLGTIQSMRDALRDYAQQFDDPGLDQGRR